MKTGIILLQCLILGLLPVGTPAGRAAGLPTGAWRHSPGRASAQLRPVAAVAQPDYFCGYVTEIPGWECRALEAFINSTGGRGWLKRTDWFETYTPCSWYGVTCANNHVVGLDLAANRLNGYLPGELSDCSELQWIDLSWNRLFGSPPWDWGARLPHLQSVNLSYSGLGENLPASWSRLSQLKELNLSGNHFWNSLPASWGQLASLQILDVSAADLTGPLPAEWGQLPALVALDLSHNHLEGPLPAEWGQLSTLTALDLSHNALESFLPPAWGDLYRLQTLDLAANSLAGLPPDEWGDMRALTALDLSANFLTALAPAIWLLPSLEYVDLSHNALAGPIFAELGGALRLRHLDLSHNRLEWGVPPTITNLPLTYLDLSHNRLVGHLADWLWWPVQPRLQHLDLGHNAFTGPAPAALGQLTALTYLDLSANQLSQPLPPALGHLPALQYLDLSRNQFSHLIPSELGQLAQLTFLDLHANQLAGPLPPALAQVGQATPAEPPAVPPAEPPGVYVDLSGNHLSGAIPAQFGANPRLAGLQLSGNDLSGSVPESLFDPSWQHLDLNYNRLTADDARFAPWQTTQTVPPADLRVTPTGATATLTWQPIPYASAPDRGDGYYEVSYAPALQGPYQVHGQTADQHTASYTLAGLTPGQAYYFRVRTLSYAHTYYEEGLAGDIFDHPYVQPNNLWSDYTPTVCVHCAGAGAAWLPLVTVN